MTNRTYKLHDTALMISSLTGEKDPNGHFGRPDYAALAAIIRPLKAQGFTFGKDPQVDTHYSILNKYHRLGSRPTPDGDLFVHTEAYPTGLKIEFFQEAVTVNHNGGRYDFDKREKMPYLIGKAFEVAIRAACTALNEIGFTFQPSRDRLDPADYFEGRYGDGPDGWPSTQQLSGKSWQIHDRDGRLIQSGETRLFRDFDGRVKRGRCFGGINGMWLVKFGPDRRSLRQLSSYELFGGDPSAMPRRQFTTRKIVQRLETELARAVQRENFEAAIRFRNALRRHRPATQEAA